MLHTIENQNPIVGPAAHSGGSGPPCHRKEGVTLQTALCPGGQMCQVPWRGPPAPPEGPALLSSTLPACCGHVCPQLTSGLSRVIADPAGPKTQSQALRALLPYPAGSVAGRGRGAFRKGVPPHPLPLSTLQEGSVAHWTRQPLLPAHSKVLRGSASAGLGEGLKSKDLNPLHPSRARNQPSLTAFVVHNRAHC